MGHADLAAIHQQLAVAGGGIDLAALTAHLMDAGIERTATAQGGLHAHGTYGDGAGEQIFGVEQAFQRERRAGLGAVEQRQPLFGCQGDGLQARNLERSGGVDQLALVAGLALPDQQAAHVGQGGQVARGADGALLRHHRIDFGVDEGHQGLEHRQADAGEAPRQRVDLEHHHQPHGGVIHVLANPCCMGEHYGALQFIQLFHRDAGVGQQAKAGVDAIHHAVLLDHLGNHGGGGVDPRQGGRVPADMDRLAADAAQGGEAELARLQIEFKHLISPLCQLCSASADPVSPLGRS